MQGAAAIGRSSTDFLYDLAPQQDVVSLARSFA
jgi:hypothetical protein